MKGSTIKALDVLEAAGDRGATTGDFIRAGSARFGARLLELKRLGYEIRRERVRDGQWRYTLITAPVGSTIAEASRGGGSSGQSSPPAPVASDAPLPAEVAVPLFELPAPGESADADRWNGEDVWGEVA